MEQQQLRSLRDFLLVYNGMTERCFQRCVAGLGERALSGEEEACLDRCAAKQVRGSHRLMSAYVRLMPGLVQRRLAQQQEQDPGGEGRGEGEGLPDRQ